VQVIPLRNDEKDVCMTDWVRIKDENGRQTKKWEERKIPLEPARLVEVRPNGVKVYSGKLGRCLQKGETIYKPNWTPATAALARKTRYEKAQQRAAEGIQRAVNERLELLADGKEVSLVNTPIDAIEHISHHATEVFLNSHSPKGMSDLGHFILKAADLVRPENEKSQSSGDLPLAGLDDAQNIIQIFNFYQERPQEFIDVEPR